MSIARNGLPAGVQVEQRFTGIPRSTIHDLRTPLTSIRGYAQLLLRGVRNPELTQRAYETILRESERLAGMLDQLSRVAEIQAPSEEHRASRFDLGRLAEVAAEQAQARWPDREIVQQAGEGTVVEADEKAMADVIGILLDNAVAYSEPPTTIEAKVWREGGEARLSVSDQGIGIPAAELERIFECFRRASNAARAGSNASRGLGVGLYIARAAVAEAGGRVWVESSLDEGSTFHLALPLAG